VKGFLEEVQICAGVLKVVDSWLLQELPGK
jgi:hypothetical protein